jgi:MarR family transcriptional regulator, organic hydroperoxide resistance regulator
LFGVNGATEQFTEAWEAFFRTTRRLRARAGRLPGEGLSLPQYHLLEALQDAAELTVGELADAAGIAPPTATRMLDCLARDGYVTRRQSETDRRAVLVALTPAGVDAFEASHEHVQAFRRRVFEALDPAEREHAAALLRRLSDVLDELS